MTLSGATRSLVVLGLAFIYALCFVAIKAVLAFGPPFLFAGLRALIAGGALLLIVLLARRPLFPLGWPGLVALSLTSTTVAFAAMFLSPGRGGAGVASVLGNLQPLFVLVLAAVFLGEAISRAKLSALVLGLAGVTLVAGPAVADTSGGPFFGALAALVASASLGVGNVILKKIGARGDVLTMTAWQLVLGGFPLLVLSAFVEGSVSVAWTPASVTLLLGLALGGTALPFLAWNALARAEEIGSLTLWLFLVPVFGVAFAFALFGETPGAAELVGLALVASAVAIIFSVDTSEAKVGLARNDRTAERVRGGGAG